MTRYEGDPGFDYLLDLDDESFEVDTESGHWVGFRVTQVPVSSEKPHGLDYSLTPDERKSPIRCNDLEVEIFQFLKGLLRNSSRISRANQERLEIVYFMTKSDNNSSNVADSFSFDA